MLSSPATSVGLEKNALRTAMRVVDCLLFSYLGSNVVFNEIEFFTYINLWLLSLLILLFVFFVLIYVTVINLTSHVGNSALVEVFVTLGSLVILFFIISPSLLLLFETDTIILPNIIINILGLQ